MKVCQSLYFLVLCLCHFTYKRWDIGKRSNAREIQTWQKKTLRRSHEEHLLNANLRWGIPLSNTNIHNRVHSLLQTFCIHLSKPFAFAALKAVGEPQKYARNEKCPKLIAGLQGSGILIISWVQHPPTGKTVTLVYFNELCP